MAEEVMGDGSRVSDIFVITRPADQRKALTIWLQGAGVELTTEREEELNRIFRKREPKSYVNLLKKLDYALWKGCLPKGVYVPSPEKLRAFKDAEDRNLAAYINEHEAYATLNAYNLERLQRLVSACFGDERSRESPLPSDPTKIQDHHWIDDDGEEGYELTLCLELHEEDYGGRGNDADLNIVFWCDEGVLVATIQLMDYDDNIADETFNRWKFSRVAAYRSRAARRFAHAEAEAGRGH